MKLRTILAAAWLVCCGVQAADFRALDPWIDRPAAECGSSLSAPLTELTLTAPQNDWISAAVALTAENSTRYRVTLETDADLTDRILLRVAGTVLDAVTQKVVFDPLLTAEQAAEFGHYVLNREVVGSFPVVTVAGADFALIWLTVDTRGLSAGSYHATLRAVAEGAEAEAVELPLTVRIGHAELPERNPLKIFAWQWNNENPEQIRDMVEHGINVFWHAQEAAWDNGAEFLLFKLSSTFWREPLDEARKDLLREELLQIMATVEKLDLPADAWAVHVSDEVSDKHADADVEAAKFIKSLYPEMPLYFNPAWGKLADGNQNNTTFAGTFEKIAPYVDIWQPYSWHFTDDAEVKKFLDAQDKPVWSYDIYGCSGRKPTMAREMLRTGPMFAWIYNLSGFGNFALNDYWGDNPWDHVKSANYALLYSNGSNAVGSRAYEAYRQGFQEYKRLYVLRENGYDPALLMQWAKRIYENKSLDDIRCAVAEMDEALELQAVGK